MTLNISSARALAMTTIAVPFGWWIATDSVATMARYRTLSHAELLKELASHNDSSVAVGIAAALFVVLAITIAVDLLTSFYSAIWARIGAPAAPASGAGPGDQGGPA